MTSKMYRQRDITLSVPEDIYQSESRPSCKHYRKVMDVMVDTHYSRLTRPIRKICSVEQ